MVNKILQHEIKSLYNDTLLLSTVKVEGIYEVALLTSDFEELKMYRFDDILEAVDCHQAIMIDCLEKVRSTYPFMRNVKLENVARRIYYNPSVA